MLRHASWCLLAIAPALCAAGKPNPQIQELQRDVAQLQEIVKTLQKSLEERIGGLGTQVQTAVEAAGKATAAAASVQKSVDRIAQDQERQLVPPVAALGSRMEQVTGTLGTMQQAIGELASVIGKLQVKIEDLSMAVKVMQQPVAPPQPVIPPAGDLMTAAERDRLSGKFELALQLYDMLIETYPDSTLLPEALFYKGETLRKLGRAAEARAAYAELRKKFPSHKLARQIPAAGRGK